MIKFIVFERFEQIQKMRSEKKDFASSLPMPEELDVIQSVLDGENLFSQGENYYFYYNNEFKSLIHDLDNFWHKVNQSPHLFWVLLNDESEINLDTFSGSEIIRLEKNNHKNKEEEQNLFSLTDAFISGDKKKTWVILDDFQKKGISAELVYFTIWWQIKVIFSVMIAPNDSGQKPFIVTKAKNVIKKNGEEKILLWKNKILDLYHGRFETTLDLYILLKKFVLEV